MDSAQYGHCFIAASPAKCSEPGPAPRRGPGGPPLCCGTTLREERATRFGRFDDEAREYVFSRPDTPLPWINYLGAEDYFGLISNTAGGYSFFRDARLLRPPRHRSKRAPLHG